MKSLELGNWELFSFYACLGTLGAPIFMSLQIKSSTNWPERAMVDTKAFVGKVPQEHRHHKKDTGDMFPFMLRYGT